MSPSLNLTNVMSGMLTMFYNNKLKIKYSILIYVIGANLMLAALQISLGSLLPVNYPV
jgi:hypothetical protein